MQQILTGSPAYLSFHAVSLHPFTPEDSQASIEHYPHTQGLIVTRIHIIRCMMEVSCARSLMHASLTLAAFPSSSGGPLM